MSLSTHVLDTTLGRPAAGIRVTLEREGVMVGSDVTDEEGRIREFRTTGALLDSASYRMRFAVAEYWKKSGTESFYPEIVINFTISTDKGHYHVPLLLSPFGYTTYRGS
jgi:5-hydroxyisourate hydrolase